MQEERETVVGDMQLQTALYKSLCLFYEAQTKCKRFTILQRSVYVHFRPNKATSQELQIFACGMTLRKAVYNHCELENCMLLVSHTSSAIVIWLKRFTLLY